MLLRSLLLCTTLLLTEQVSSKPFVSKENFPRAVTIIPPTVADAPSVVEFTSKATGLDAPKVSPINATTFDWWYFDAVGSDLNSSVVVTFFTATPSGFMFLTDLESADSVYVWVSFANGTAWSTEFPATNAIVTTKGNGASGVWEGAGSAFAGSPESGRYVVTIDAPQYGVKGTLQLNSRAPAHYPCGPMKAGQTEEVAPHIGWSNAVPDALAIADFTIFGSDKVHFIGAGYHDKNWSDQTFAASVQSWYWGHGELGPFSIVWFSFIDPSGNTHISSFVAKSSKPILSTCSSTSLTVRPIGSDYPPSPTSPEPTGFHLSFDLGEQGKLEAEVTTTAKVAEAESLYRRWIGGISGTLGRQKYTGKALYEEFNLTPLSA